MSMLGDWRRYAGCWSAEPPERSEVLATVVVDDVTYCDPGQVVEGAPALGAYMDGFRQTFPGNRFVIDRVDAHHGRSLAQWRQLDADDGLVMNGVSFAIHGDDGRLAQIAGFFPLGPEPAGTA